MRSKKLSIIVPVYRAENYIALNLLRMKESFSRYFPNNEIIAVIDGHVDNSFEEAMRVSGIQVHGYSQNMGKGFALKYGFRFCTGDYVTFMDCDMDINPEMIRNFIPYMASADVVIGSKRHPFSEVDYPLYRKALSRGYHLFLWLVLGLRLRDTQTGLKVVKREVLEVIMPLILVKRYAFDAELCFLAQKHGFRIVEAPIRVNYKFNGTGINTKSIWGMFIDTLAIRYRYTILHYYQKKYKRDNFRFNFNHSK